MKNIRNSVKAIIIQNDQILLTKNKDDEGFFYLCPGGGQEHGENLADAVHRECLEEIGEKVEVGDLVYVRELMEKDHDGMDVSFHQVEFYFSCTLVSDSPTFEHVSLPDDHQVGVEWIDIKLLDEIRIYPAELGKRVKHKNVESRYLGDVK
ncbi:NUDIX domain-containing protein [Paenibacillus glycanilyticus]|uniref:DNA mismatch repair protein MutT n=1 Tax=Paenibacillus glycanilyticus TaxID=126569 RepID=A0ABQ6GJW4_9BACL|nr:NUDIX domain-containing protein [Paenibacillus glycanilyticus]GLX69337.1 DNA mismatch repair protein MutT [Paenibacillus glycanilyticus]